MEHLEKSFMSEYGRMVIGLFVGDPKQAIYRLEAVIYAPS